MRPQCPFSQTTEEGKMFLVHSKCSTLKDAIAPTDQPPPAAERACGISTSLHTLFAGKVNERCAFFPSSASQEFSRGFLHHRFIDLQLLTESRMLETSDVVTQYLHFMFCKSHCKLAHSERRRGEESIDCSFLHHISIGSRVKDVIHSGRQRQPG